jgi:hypothetical protein
MKIAKCEPAKIIKIKLTNKKIAAILSISKRQVAKMRKNKTLPSYYL